MSQNGKSSRGMNFPHRLSSRLQHVTRSLRRNVLHESSLEFLISKEETKPTLQEVALKCVATNKKPRLTCSHNSVCPPHLWPPGKPQRRGVSVYRMVVRQGPRPAKHWLAAWVQQRPFCFQEPEMKAAMSQSSSLGTRCSARDSPCKPKCNFCNRGREQLQSKEANCEGKAKHVETVAFQRTVGFPLGKRW